MFKKELYFIKQTIKFAYLGDFATTVKS